jgi:hypothetical protein
MEKKDSRIAFLTSKAGKLHLHANEPYGVTADEFLKFTVSDSPEPCFSCDIDPPRAPAPIRIGSKKFCLWCALEIAHEILAGGPR